MSAGRRGLGLVAGREIREALRRKSFWIVAALLLVASIAGAVVPDLLSDDDPPQYDVVLVDGSPALESALEQAVLAIDGELELTAADEAAARQQVEDGDVDAGVVAGTDTSILVKAGENERLVGVVRQALALHTLASGLVEAGVPADQADALLATPPAAIVELDTEQAGRQGAAFTLALVMYLVLLMLMMQVANGVAVEKSNRISEVLLAIVRPGALLFGKVIGVGVIGLATMSILALPFVVKLALGGDLPEGFGGALAGGALWLLLGGTLYLILAGALGALVERQEEAGTVTAPLSVLLVGTYLVGGTNPDSTVSQVLSYIPLTSPMITPPRIAVGAASTVELVASVSLSLLAIALVGRFGAVIYRRAIVRTGRRLKVTEVLRGT